ncbi:MAG TPA: flagellin [Spirochaetota bacterium]|nr:flagellin [Spirochaetota bacterium]
MIINNNINALRLDRLLKFKNWDIEKTSEKVASGLRINRAGDDAAGLALSEVMMGQIRGLRQAERNAEDGISFIQTAEGYLAQTGEILTRIRTLAVQSSHGTNSDEERIFIQAEVSQLIDEVDRIASSAEYNGAKILLGGLGRQSRHSSMWFHIGANMHHKERVYIQTMTARGLRLRGAAQAMNADLRTADGSNEAIGLIDRSIEMLTRQRADLGAAYSRLEKAAEGLMNTHTNVQFASSLVRDADVAEEMVALTKDQILSKSGTRVLINASTSPAAVLRVLRS